MKTEWVLVSYLFSSNRAMYFSQQLPTFLKKAWPGIVIKMTSVAALASDQERSHEDNIF